MAKTEKEISEIEFGIERIQEIMNKIRPNKRWYIEYMPEFDEGKFTDWQISYHGMCKDGEYILIYSIEEDTVMDLLYVIDVSWNSSMYTLKCLVDILAEKF